MKCPLSFGLMIAVFLAPSLLQAEEASITAEPVQYAFVNGNAGKFRAQHWMKDRYAGGISDFDFEKSDLPYDVSISAEGHGVLDAHDYQGLMSLKKKEFGYLNIDFTEFRKYYPSMGGVYRRFNTLRFNELDKDLYLDIGHFSVETGLTLQDFPEIVFFYEHDFKDGDKSHLTWTAVKEGRVTRNIGPVWQGVNETVDTFAVKANHQIKGVELHGEQKFEIFRASMSRVEKNLSTTGVPADEKIRTQNQDPEADALTTTVGAEKWIWNEKGFMSGAYRFARIDHKEQESIFETNENGSITNFANPKQIRNARAHNLADSHTWVGSFMAVPWTCFNVITRFKSEVAARDSDSYYPGDTAPAIPDGIINTNDISNNNSKTSRWGEGISLRFTKIPRTAFYNDLEFEQIRSWLSEDRNSIGIQSPANTGEIFSRETFTHSQRGIWTLGVHAAPFQFIRSTAQVRHRQNNTDYDDKRETLPGATTARSAFVELQNISTNEFTTRTTFRLWRWLQPAFRYQFFDQHYKSRFEDEPTSVTTSLISHVYTFDVMVQPLVNLMTTASFSRQNAATRTPARDASVANTPTFNANVNTWMFDAGYAVRPEAVLTSTVLYSRADNFNDFSDAGLPLGTDNERIECSLGIRYALSKHLWLEPKYAFYQFRANPDVEIGNYNAHVIWINIRYHWK